MTPIGEGDERCALNLRVYKRIKQELIWLTEWHGTSLTVEMQLAIHERAMRILPGITDTGILGNMQTEYSEQEREQEEYTQKREEILI